MNTDIRYITLLDETIREGDARGYHPKTPAERIELVRTIHAITGIREYCIGWCVLSDNDAATLHGFIDACQSGLLPDDAVGHVFDLFQAQPRLDQIVRDIRPDARKWLAVDLATVASDELAPMVDGPWLAQRIGETRGPKAIPIDELHRQLAGCAGERVAALQGQGLHHVGVIVQDAFRCRYQSLHTYVSAALDAGADVIRLHDTVGIATPTSTVERLDRLVAEFPDARFFGHFHNDFGMATANAITAIGCGVAGVDVTVNGVGNRAGNAGTAEVLMALHVIHGIRLPGVHHERLFELARTVERYFGLATAPYAPVTGRLLYTDEASLRSHQIETVSRTSWLPYDPRDVGGILESAHTLVSGRQAVAMLFERKTRDLAALGIVNDDALVDRAHRWCHAQLHARANLHRPRIHALQEMYEAELRRSYLTDTEILTQAWATGGRFGQ